MSAIFVTGAGTDVGKTYVMCRLIEALGQSGHEFRALKPVVSGFDSGQPAATDTGRILAAAGLELNAENLDATSPWRFSAPLSPDMAAEREGAEISFERLVEFSRPKRGVELTLVEGVGGVMVPVDAEHTVLDWIEALGAPALLVVGSYLGTLSHSLTAAAALKSRNIELLGIVVSESLDSPVPITATAATLGRFASQAPIVTLPRNEPGRDGVPADPAGSRRCAARLLALLDPILGKP